ncbi:hypothetical protein ACOSQ4_018161 [Xanthoceras sorbifolium]
MDLLHNSNPGAAPHTTSKPATPINTTGRTQLQTTLTHSAYTAPDSNPPAEPQAPPTQLHQGARDPRPPTSSKRKPPQRNRSHHQHKCTLSVDRRRICWERHDPIYQHEDASE